MPNLCNRLLLALITLVTLAACSKKQESAPPPAPATSNPAAAQPAPAAPTAQAPAASFEGQWEGSSGEDLPISFTIQGNEVTSFSGSYAGKNGSCSFNGSINSSGPAPITSKAFSTSGKSSHEELSFTAQGTLSSATEASGTLVWKGKSQLCGDIDLQYKWAAKKAPAEAVDLE